MRLLSNPEFLKHLLKHLHSAEKEIVISTYLFNWTGEESDPTGLIIDALAKASRRGVDVRVFLEGSQRLRAVKARNALESNGVKVFFDTPATFLHEKVVLVDGSKIFIGSQNFTRVSLTTNIERAVYIEDSALALQVAREIKERRYQAGELTGAEGVPVPVEFILTKASVLLRNNAHRCFDLYIRLLRMANEGGKPQMLLDYKKLASGMGIERPRHLKLKESDYSKYYHSNVLQEILLDLERNYDLIDYDAGRKRVSLKGLEESRRQICLPGAYFKYGWDKRLGLAAKVSLLIHIYETERSKVAPWWFRSQKDIAKLYGLYPDTFSKGSRELKYFNLVEIEGRMQPRGKAYDERPANHYSLRPFYSMDDFEKRLDDFRNEKGRAVMNRILKMARELGEPWDLSVIQEFADLKEEYGMKRLVKAHGKVAKLATHNPMRSVVEVARLLRK